MKMTVFSFTSVLCFRVHPEYVLSLCHWAKFEHVRFTPYGNGRKGCYWWIWIWLIPTAIWVLMHTKQIIYHWATPLAIYSFLILKIIAGFGCTGLKIWRILTFFPLWYHSFFKEWNKNKPRRLSLYAVVFLHAAPQNVKKISPMSASCLLPIPSEYLGCWVRNCCDVSTLSYQLALMELYSLLHYCLSGEYGGDSFSVTSLWLTLFPKT